MTGEAEGPKNGDTRTGPDRHHEVYADGDWYRTSDLPTRHFRKDEADEDPDRCLASVHLDRMGFFRCSKRRREGSDWCGSHHPSTAKRRRIRHEAKVKARDERREASYADRLSWSRIEPHLCEGCRKKIEEIRKG